MWTVGCSEPKDQANAVFETTTEVSDALSRMTALQHDKPSSYIWASGDFYDIVACHVDGDEVGFVVRPSTETESEPPAICLPYDAEEMLEVVAAGTATVAADDDCPTCATRRRGRYANRGVSGQPLFICSTCERWTETLPEVASPGPRSRKSQLAD